MNNKNLNSVVPNNIKSPDSLKDITKKIASKLEDALEHYETSLYVDSWEGNGTIIIDADSSPRYKYNIMVRQCSSGEIELVYHMTNTEPGEEWDEMGSCSSVEEFVEQLVEDLDLETVEHE